MKRLIFVIFGIIIFCGLSAQDIPQKISYQGKLYEDGYPVTGTKTITFTIGAWSETHSNVQITDGLYSVTLGETTPIPTSIFNNSSSITLEIEVEGTALSPQTEILSSPYAYKAEKAVDAEKLNGQQASYYNNWNNLNNIPADIADGDDINDADYDPNNEIQDLSSSSSGTQRTITISGGGNSTTIDVADNDNSTSNEIQTLSQSGNNVTLSNGGGTISVADNDNSTSNEIQTLSLSGNNLSLNPSGGSVTLPSSSSPWTQNGSNIYYNSGNVGIGITNPSERLYVAAGTIEVYPSSDGQRGIRLRSANQNKNFILDMKNNGRMVIGSNSGVMQLASTFGVQSRDLSDNWRIMEASSFDVVSSKNLKKNIKYDQSKTTYWLEQIIQMKPATYIYNWEEESAKPKFGFIVEDLPEELKGQDNKSVNLYALTTAGISGIKSLYQILEKQQELIKKLQVEVELLKNKLEK